MFDIQGVYASHWRCLDASTVKSSALTGDNIVNALQNLAHSQVQSYPAARLGVICTPKLSKFTPQGIQKRFVRNFLESMLKALTESFYLNIVLMI